MILSILAYSQIYHSCIFATKAWRLFRDKELHSILVQNGVALGIWAIRAPDDVTGLIAGYQLDGSVYLPEKSYMARIPVLQRSNEYIRDKDIPYI